MRKKNLSVKVAALAMSGTLAMAPMTVRADEVAATTAAPVSPDVITNSDGSISLREPAVASNTTVENHVNDVVADDKQGTDIGLQVGSRKMEAKISAQDANENGQDTIGKKNPSLNPFHCETGK